MINPMNLLNKHILITGASSGIGRQCAIIVSQLGANVTIIARNEEKLKETLSKLDNLGCHEFYTADLNETEQIEELINKIILQRGAVDGFCHAAGIMQGRSLKASKPEFIQKIFNIHSFAFFELVRCLSQKKRLNGNASIVGISSAAVDNGALLQCGYAAAKASMNGFIKVAALELKEQKIRINNVAFANVDTPTWHDNFDDCGGNMDVLLQKQYLGLIDLDSAAYSIAFLLSEASKYITGSVLQVYAGL